MPAKINQHYRKLGGRWLFSEIAKRTREFEARTGIKPMKLGIGDTKLPIPPAIIKGLHHGVDNLASRETYTGYGDEQGDSRLRQAIANYYLKRGIRLAPDEVFVSDGAKPDTGNIQTIFSLDNIVALQDPAYPAYENTNVAAGRTGDFDDSLGGYKGLVYMPCTEENGFWPSLPEKADLIYLCSPNNPTGAVATKEQLAKFVDFARKNKSVIIFDAAYAPFIADENLPKSIYEINRAEECAIEIQSFSKIAGFTGVRLGWTVVPKTVVASDSNPGELNSLWNRRQTTFFNGACNIAQEGGLAALTEQGQEECQALADYYLENARIIRQGLAVKGLRVVSGGINAPYLLVRTPNSMKSWDCFDQLLEQAHVVSTPGSGFGPSGEGYIRLSAFGYREDIEKAVDSIKGNLRI